MDLQTLKLSEISESPTNPREDFNKAELAALAEDIAQRGLVQPILVRRVGEHFEIIAGARRYRAHQLAELATITAVVVEMTDREAEEAQIVENEKRDNLKPLEKAKGYAGIIERHGVTPDELALTLKISRSTLYATLRLNHLVEAGRKALRDGVIPEQTAKVLARVHSTRQEAAIKDVVGGRYPGDPPMSFRQALQHVQTNYMLDLSNAPFDTNDAELEPEAKACTTCDKRTGAHPDEGAKLEPDLCTDSPCWNLKTRLTAAADAAKRGLELLDAKEVVRVFSKFGDLQGAEYVKADSPHPGSSSEQTYAELIKPEQKKELMVIAIDPRGHIVELLRSEGLKAAIEETGKLRKRKAAPNSKASPELKAKAHAAAEKAKVDKKLRERLNPALAAAVIAAVEKRGLDRKLLATCARLALSTADYVGERRGLKFNVFQLNAKTFDKHFGSYTPAQLAGLLFEAVADRIFGELVEGAVEEFEELAVEVGVDVRKIEASFRAAEAQAEKSRAMAKGWTPTDEKSPAKKASKKKAA